MLIEDYLDALTERRAFFSSMVSRLEQLDQHFERDTARLHDLHARTRQELAAYLLADVDDEAIAVLEQRLRYPALLAIKRQFDEALRAVHVQIEELAARPEIAHFELHRGQVDDELAELMPAYTAHEAIEEIFTSSPYFHELQERGWFDPRYEPDGYFVRLRNWRATSLLLEDLDAHLERFERSEPFEHPDEARQAWNQHSETWSSVSEAVTDLRKRASELDALKTHCDALQRRPRELFDEMYGALCQAVLGHLESCPEALRFELARQDEHLTTFLKKEAGLRKQVSYLEQLRIARVGEWRERASREVDKLGRKLTKIKNKRMRGRTPSVTRTQVAKTRELKADKWDKRLGRLEDTRTRIATFTKYQKGSFTDDYLWWDVMTGGARADDIYEVRAFRERHPDWDYRRYSEPWARDAHGDHDDAAAHLVTAMALDEAAEMLADDLSRPDDDHSFDLS